MTVVNYLWNPINDNIVEEFDDSGNTIAEYTTEPDEFGDVISQHRDGQESFYHTDGLGSTLALTNVNGDVTDTYAYSAFGEVTARTGGTVNPFQYIGQKQYYRDAETGDYEVRRRPFSPSKTRWISVDPSGISSGDLNIFRYARNCPIDMIDPSGLAAIRCQCRGVGEIGGPPWIRVNCPGQAINCCTRACRGKGGYRGNFELVGQIPDTIKDVDTCGDEWWNLPTYFDCLACCIRKYEAGAQIAEFFGEWTENHEMIVYPNAARLPKQRAFGLKKGFRLDLGTRLPNGRYICPVARTENVWVAGASRGAPTVAGRAVGRAATFVVIAEGAIDWGAICWCACRCLF